MPRSFGGILLSTEYVRLREKLIWKCASGHTFSKSAGHILNRGQWCPYCVGRKTLKDVKDLAKPFGIELLSKQYKNTTEKLEWKCSEGHIFSKSVKNILRRGLPSAKYTLNPGP